MKTLRAALATAALSLAAVSPCTAQLTGTVIVLNKPASAATFIDLGERRIAVGTDYGGGDASLSVFDVASARRIRTIELGTYTRPHGIAFLPGEETVAVTSESTGNVVIVRVSDGEIVSAIPTEANGSHMLGVTADGQTIRTGDMASDTVTELSLRTGAKVRSFPAPADGIAYSPVRVAR